MRKWSFLEIAFAVRTAIVYMLILLGIGFAWHEMEVFAYGYSQESVVDAYAAIFITDTIMRRLLNR